MPRKKPPPFQSNRKNNHKSDLEETENALDYEVLKKAFARVFDEDAIVSTLHECSATEKKSFLDMFFKVSKSEDQQKATILQESLYNLPNQEQLSNKLTVAMAEIRRLREQLFVERTTLQALESMVTGATKAPKTWLLLFRIIQNIMKFYKRYYEERRQTPVDPNQWLEIMHDELGIGDEIDKDWEIWQLIKLDPTSGEKEAYDTIKFTKRNGDCVALSYVDGRIKEEFEKLPNEEQEVG